jgi:hypothetical protein
LLIPLKLLILNRSQPKSSKNKDDTQNILPEIRESINMASAMEFQKAWSQRQLSIGNSDDHHYHEQEIEPIIPVIAG